MLIPIDIAPASTAIFYLAYGLMLSIAAVTVIAIHGRTLVRHPVGAASA